MKSGNKPSPRRVEFVVLPREQRLPAFARESDAQRRSFPQSRCCMCCRPRSCTSITIRFHCGVNQQSLTRDLQGTTSVIKQSNLTSGWSRGWHKCRSISHEHGAEAGAWYYCTCIWHEYHISGSCIKLEASLLVNNTDIAFVKRRT